LTDLLGGQIQAIFSTTPPAIGYIKAGKLRGLAVTSAARSDALPELPSIGDFVPGYEATLVLGLGAPKNVPAEIAEQLNKETTVVLTDPAMKVRLANLGNEPLPITSADFGRLLASETEKWAKVIQANHIKAT
jgi:tripartite-type tricarboxylate transporter receptor subunit TctC